MTERASIPDKFIEPDKTALIVIDMQKGFCDVDSMMEKIGPGAAGSRAVIPAITELVGKAREHGIQIVWIKQIHYPDDVTRQRRRIPSHIGKQKGWAPNLRGTWEVEFTDEIAKLVRPEDDIVEKHRASAFFETNLDTKLRMRGIEEVVIAGVNTEYCIETSVRDAYFRDLDVIVVRDCVGTGRPEFHNDTLAKIDFYFGAVIGLDEFDSVIMDGEDSDAAGNDA